jgi:hypothetical protein
MKKESPIWGSLSQKMELESVMGITDVCDECRQKGSPSRQFYCGAPITTGTS